VRRFDAAHIALVARQRLLLAPAEWATALVVVVIALAAMLDTRGFAVPDTSKAPGGIGSGFYPFWAAAVMGVAGLVIMYRALTRSTAGPPLFENRQAIVSVGKLVAPMLLATAALSWLGFYLCSGLYMGFFARYIGRYHWRWVAAVAVLFPLAIYLAFEMGFRVRLPKSGLYELGFLI